MTNDDKEKAWLLLEISKTHRERVHNRRDYEWKLALALWSALAIIIASLFAQNAQIVAVLPWVLGGTVLLAGVFILVWLPGVAWRQYYDGELAKSFLCRVEEIIAREKDQPPLRQSSEKQKDKDKELPDIENAFQHWRLGFRKLWNFACLTQIAVTVAMLLLLALAVYVASTPSSKEQSSQGQVLEMKYTTSQPSKSITSEIRN